jgi:transposase
MSQNPSSAVDVIGIDIGKNSFHVVGLDRRGAIVLRQKWSRGQAEARLVNMPPCLIGMEACVGAHHLSRKLKAFGHDARLMPAKYVRPYSKGQKNDFRMRRRSLRRCSARRKLRWRIKRDYHEETGRALTCLECSARIGRESPWPWQLQRLSDIGDAPPLGAVRP